MNTPRELFLARHQSAEVKLKGIRAEDLAVYARSAAEPSLQRPPAFDLAASARRFWQDTFEPWRRAWIGIGAVWLKGRRHIYFLELLKNPVEKIRRNFIELLSVRELDRMKYQIGRAHV